MKYKRLGFVSFAILLAALALLTVAADKSHPAGGAVIDPTCNSPFPCLEYDNNGTGPGVRGVSLGGSGITTSTKFNSTSAANGRAAVFGNDQSSSGSFDSGVQGQSVRGTGVLGSSTSGMGLQGISASNSGINVIGGSGTFSVEKPALSIVANAGAEGDLVDACSSGVRSCNSEMNPLFRVISTGHIFGKGATLDALTDINVFGGTALIVRGLAAIQAQPDGLDLLDMFGVVGPAVFKVDQGGNLFIAGTITTGGSCSVGCAAKTAAGYHVVSYAPAESLPTMEDTGEAQLINGAAYVRIDPAFANVIDKTASYLVLITPEGPSRGLYVTQKTPAGFAVIENPGGHSTLAFSYRIVAKPYGSTKARLPMVYTPKGGPVRPGGSSPSQQQR